MLEQRLLFRERNKMKFILKIAVLVLLTAITVQIQAGTKNINIIAGFPAGTGHDLVARQLASDINAGNEFNVVVENKVGAGGTIAVNDVANTKNTDPPKLLIFTNTLYVNSFITHRLDINTPNLLKPVGFIGYVPLVLNVNANTDINTLKDVKNFKGISLRAGTGGKGSLPETNSLYLGHLLNAPIESIPYTGQNKAFIDLASGQIDIVFDYYASSMPFIEGGKVRPILVTGNHRLPKLPNVPTFKEQGINWPLESFYMLYASTNISDSDLTKLKAIVTKSLKNNPVPYRDTLGITLNLDNNKNVEQFHENTIYHYRHLKFPVKD